MKIECFILRWGNIWKFPTCLSTFHFDHFTTDAHKFTYIFHSNFSTTKICLFYSFCVGSAGVYYHNQGPEGNHGLQYILYSDEKVCWPCVPGSRLWTTIWCKGYVGYFITTKRCLYDIKINHIIITLFTITKLHSTALFFDN